MFYDKFTKICEERGEKPTPLVVKLGLSRGNLKSWQNGATINSNVLIKIARYFNVTTDYLLGLSDNSNYTDTNNPEYTEEESKFLQKFRKLNADGKRIISEHADDLVYSNRYEIKE